MIRKHVILKELNGEIIPEYVISVCCDKCPTIISFQKVSGEQLMAIDREEQLCEVCKLQELGLGMIVRSS